ncbi:MAG: 5'-methylthioadenosine/S-adenosylhomocysteine nucleosidase [Candidatus Aminicenantales bacterium]
MKNRKPAMIVFGLFAALAALAGPRNAGPPKIDAAVLVSADAEWSAVRSLHPHERYETSPFGQYFYQDVTLLDRQVCRLLVFHGGWGKVAAAASTQYVIDRWDPALIVNLGTCGGFEGAVERYAIILAAKTVIYDVVERMGNPEEAIADYSTTIDLGWLEGPDPPGVRRGVLVSADQDAAPASIALLKSKYGAAAVDWESGAIAFIARRNKKRILILRGVTDVVGQKGDETYGHIEIFRRNTEIVMKQLFTNLPLWLLRVRKD